MTLSKLTLKRNLITKSIKQILPQYSLYQTDIPKHKATHDNLELSYNTQIRLDMWRIIKYCYRSYWYLCQNTAAFERTPIPVPDTAMLALRSYIVAFCVRSTVPLYRWYWVFSDIDFQFWFYTNVSFFCFIIKI